MTAARAPFVLGGAEVAAGERAVVGLPAPRLTSQTELRVPVHVVHGRRDGPRVFVSAAIHGDELNGVEIIRRLLLAPALRRLRGTLVAVPVVNPYGLIHESRYLPDRRDLNRAFPGSERGSLAARLAHLFVTEVLQRCTHGLDLHTGATRRPNLPQIRANLDDAETRRLALAFGVPVVLNAPLRDGSLRDTAGELGVPVLVYEAGEALRFDEFSVRAGTAGVINVLRALDMLPASKRRTPRREPFVARSSRWVRAPESGLLNANVPLGAGVSEGDVLAYVDDPYSGAREAIVADTDGVVIGRLDLPLVHEGDAVYHVAHFRADESDVADGVESFQADIEEASTLA